MIEQTLYRQVQHVVSDLIHTMPRDAWAHQTPCSGWDVKALVNHMVGENLWMPELFAGKTIREIGDRLDGDVLGGDPVSSWDNASKSALACIVEPNAMQRIVHLSFGDTKGSDYLLQMAIDQTIHAWDLATSMNRSIMWPDEHVETIYESFVPLAEKWRGPGGIGPAIPVSEEASMVSKLVALSGRDPNWQSTS